MNTLCIVGLGMIGGSLAAGLKKAGYEGKITALVRSPASGERGLELGYIDEYSTNAADLIPTADVVMLAQFSMASAANAARGCTNIPVLTSPESSMRAMRTRVSANTEKVESC